MPEFQYTLDNPRLSTSQREFYERNGYLIIKNIVEDEILDELADYFRDLCEGRVEKGPVITLMKDVSLKDTGVKGEFLFNKAQDIAEKGPFPKYFQHKQLLDYVECFCGPNITCVNSMLVNKPPDSGKLTSIHPLHQDMWFFPFRAENHIVASWTAMEEVTEENGCLIIIPGTHKLNVLLDHKYPTDQIVNKAFYQISGFDSVPTLSLPMEKGDTVFFHPFLIHGSLPNTSNRFRKAISGHYTSSDYRFIEVKGTLQENVMAEMEQIAHKRGFDFNYKDIFQFKSTCVRGNPRSHL